MIDFAIVAACILGIIGINILLVALRGSQRLREAQKPSRR